MLEKHSFSHPMHQRKNEIPKKKTNNAYLMLQNHHQILEKDKLPMERERERWYRKKPIQSNKEQIKEKKSNVNQ